MSTSPFSHDALGDRLAGQEAGYFRNKDATLVAKLKSVFEAKTTKEELRQATGITDEAVLDRLVAVNVNQQMLAVFRLYPLIEIAWADRKLDHSEISAIEAAAEKVGVERGSYVFERLQEWIRKGPTEEARTVWFLYAEALRKKLTKEELAEFRVDLLKFANSVAEASGGFFGVFGSTSPGEAHVIKRVEAALTPE